MIKTALASDEIVVWIWWWSLLIELLDAIGPISLSSQVREPCRRISRLHGCSLFAVSGVPKVLRIAATVPELPEPEKKAVSANCTNEDASLVCTQCDLSWFMFGQRTRRIQQRVYRIRQVSSSTVCWHSFRGFHAIVIGPYVNEMMFSPAFEPYRFWLCFCKAHSIRAMPSWVVRISSIWWFKWLVRAILCKK